LEQPIGPILPIGCIETSVRNYHYSLRNNLEERYTQTLDTLGSMLDGPQTSRYDAKEKTLPQSGINPRLSGMITILTELRRHV